MSSIGLIDAIGMMFNPRKHSIISQVTDYKEKSLSEKRFDLKIQKGLQLWQCDDEVTRIWARNEKNAIRKAANLGLKIVDA